MGMTYKDAIDRGLSKCLSCPFGRWVDATESPDDEIQEPVLVCDPPMGECPAEFPTDYDDQPYEPENIDPRYEFKDQYFTMLGDLSYVC